MSFAVLSLEYHFVFLSLPTFPAEIKRKETAQSTVDHESAQRQPAAESVDSALAETEAELHTLQKIMLRGLRPQ